MCNYYTDMIGKYMRHIKNILNYSLRKINKEITKRNRKIKFKDIMYFITYMNNNSCSYTNANTHLKIKKILNVCNASFVKKRKNINASCITAITDALLTDFYKKCNNPRFIAVDGSHLNLYKCINNDGARLSRNKLYSKILINSLYDIHNKICINYAYSTKFNERSLLVEQLKYIKKRDVLIMDAGYYSNDILNTLVDRKIDSIFRLSKNYKMVKKLIKSDINDIIIKMVTNTGNIINFRLIKYTVGKNNYYIGTTLLKYTVESLKLLYKQRWLVETDFFYSKYYHGLKTIKSKNLHNVEHDIMSINFISVITSLFERFTYTNNNIKNGYNINRKNVIHSTTNYLLYILFYKRITKSVIKKLSKLMILIVNTVVKIQPNRHYVRIKKSPGSHWSTNSIYYYYNRIKKKK